MSDKPSCETCTNVNRSRLKLCANTNYYCTVISDFISYDDESMIKKVGCASHPQAREWLMKDVIEELQRQKTVCANYFSFNREAALEEAIALIKEGVKK